MMGEHDEDEEDPEPSGGHAEEIDRDQVPDVIGQLSFSAVRISPSFPSFATQPAFVETERDGAFM